MDEDYHTLLHRRSKAAKHLPALDKSKTRVEGNENCPNRTPCREASLTETPKSRPCESTPGVPLQPLYSWRVKTFKYDQNWTAVHRHWHSGTSPVNDTDSRLKVTEVVSQSNKTKRIEISEQVASSQNLAGKLLRDRATRKSRSVPHRKRKSRRDLFLDLQTSSTLSRRRTSRKRDSPDSRPADPSHPLGLCDVSVSEVSAEEVVSDDDGALSAHCDSPAHCRKVSVPNAVVTVSSSTQTSTECSSPVTTEPSEEVLETPLSLRIKRSHTSRRSKNKSCQTRFKPSEEIPETPPITRVSLSPVSQSGENVSGKQRSEASEEVLETPTNPRINLSWSISQRGENATGRRHGSPGGVAPQTAADIEKERQLVVLLERLDTSGGALQSTVETSARRVQRRKSCLKVRSEGYRTRSRSRRRVSFLLDEPSPPPTRRVSDSPARRSPLPQQLLRRRELPPCLSMGDRVFAKLRGYPPWPAIVTEATREHDVACRYPVYFYGTGETATLHLRDIYPYEEYEGFFGRDAIVTGRKRRRHSLLEAIEQLEAAYVSTRR